MVDLILRAARVEDCSEIADVGIDAGRIVALGPCLDLPARREIQLEGRVVIPGFVNPHVHLDKAFVGGLAPSGIMLEGVARGRELKATYTREDIKRRARRALDLAIRHGVTAIRSPADVDPIVGTLCVEALAELREEYRRRLDLQVLAFPQEGFLGVAGMHDLLRRAVEVGADVVGGRPHGDPPEALDYDRHIADVFAIADGRPIDMSVDALFPPEPVDPYALGVYRLAEATISHGYPTGQVTAHHVLALSAVDAHSAAAVVERVREAGLNIVTLPTSNLFTEGRTDAKNPRRGLTRVKDFLRAGVNVAFGTDNLDDTYLPFSNIDPLLEAHVCAVAAHLGTVEERRALMRMATHNAARVLGIEDYGIAVGCRADLVVLDTTDYDAIIGTRPEKLHVIKDGAVVVTNRATTETHRSAT
jgi:cytosine deaminase